MALIITVLLYLDLHTRAVLKSHNARALKQETETLLSERGQMLGGSLGKMLGSPQLRPCWPCRWQRGPTGGAGARDRHMRGPRAPSFPHCRTEEAGGAGP